MAAGWRRAHRIVTVRFGDKTLVPRFLLLDDGHPDPTARGALRVLAGQGFTESQAAIWWTVPAPVLCGRRPVDVLLDARRLPPEQRARASTALAAGAHRFREWF